MSKRTLIATPFLMLIAAFVLWLWVSPSGLSQAPDIKFSMADGRSIDLRQLRGKPVLVTFWATSCIGCVREMPHLIALYNDLADEGLEIIGVAMPYDPPNQVINMITERQIPYPIAIDIEGDAVVAFGDVLVTPTSFLIAPDGRIAKHTIGEMDMTELRNIIINMLSNQNNISATHITTTPAS